MTTSPEYRVWQNMLARCSDPTQERYGGRGISVCERWLDFAAFIDDMGQRPSPNHQIDRIDNNGNYEPTNCRWATRSQQMENRWLRTHVTFDGRTMAISRWAAELGISHQTLRWRLVHWPLERAMSSDVRPFPWGVIRARRSG